ncbi:MAG: hypothetical protein ACYDH9_00875 [Limisphaerales bacterium]
MPVENDLIRSAVARARRRDSDIQFPHASEALLVSIETDVFPRHAPDKSVLIDGAIGELSAFHQTFGYYAHGVDETTASLPVGWPERLVPNCVCEPG